MMDLYKTNQLKLQDQMSLNKRTKIDLCNNDHLWHHHNHHDIIIITMTSSTKYHPYIPTNHLNLFHDFKHQNAVQ